MTSRNRNWPQKAEDWNLISGTWTAVWSLGQMFFPDDENFLWMLIPPLPFWMIGQQHGPWLRWSFHMMKIFFGSITSTTSPSWFWMIWKQHGTWHKWSFQMWKFLGITSSASPAYITVGYRSLNMSPSHLVALQSSSAMQVRSLNSRSDFLHDSQTLHSPKYGHALPLQASSSDAGPGHGV